VQSLVSAKGIIIGISIPVIAGVILLFGNIMANERAEVTYQLQGENALNPSRNLPLEVFLYEGNSGNFEAGTIATVTVTNATIMQVSVSGIGQPDLYNYCQYNSTLAKISNLTAAKGSSLTKWATIYVTPDQGVKTFQISTSLTLASDWMHPRNSVMATLPTTLVYNRTSTDLYELLD
jgi:hypothetical protein